MGVEHRFFDLSSSDWTRSSRHATTGRHFGVAGPILGLHFNDLDTIVRSRRQPTAFWRCRAAFSGCTSVDWTIVGKLGLEFVANPRRAALSGPQRPVQRSALRMGYCQDEHAFGARTRRRTDTAEPALCEWTKTRAWQATWDTSPELHRCGNFLVGFLDKQILCRHDVNLASSRPLAAEASTTAFRRLSAALDGLHCRV